MPTLAYCNQLHRKTVIRKPRAELQTDQQINQLNK